MQTPPKGALTWPSNDVPVPQGNDRHPILCADAYGLLNLVIRQRKDDRIRRFGHDPGRRVGMLFANSARRDKAIAEYLRQFRYRSLNGGRIRTGADNVAHFQVSRSNAASRR